MTWIPVSDPPPPDDFHTWARPASAPCPDCLCCSARLCNSARAQQSFCDVVGSGADFDLGKCPCVGSRRPKPAQPPAETP